MENIKFTLFLIIVVLVFGVLGYWAFSSMESGSYHVDREKQEKLEEENALLQKEVEKLKSELRLLEEEMNPPVTPATNTPPLPQAETPSTPPATSSKHQTLINELQKLVDANINMKEKSKGTRVGTVQTFLNIYFGTNKKIDNDYGKTTKADVTEFQKREGLTADGEAGPSTFKAMIAWLEKQ